MNIGGIVYESLVDGEGIRNVIFTSGCVHGCKGCHNKKLWDFNYGEEFTLKKQMEFIEECKTNPLLDGITLSGGEPMLFPQTLFLFIKEYKKANPNHTIWIYTGFTYEDCLKNEERTKLLSLCDVLVDGKFESNKKDPSLKFRGSSNQRIINLKNSTK